MDEIRIGSLNYYNKYRESYFIKKTGDINNLFFKPLRIKKDKYSLKFSIRRVGKGIMRNNWTILELEGGKNYSYCLNSLKKGDILRVSCGSKDIRRSNTQPSLGRTDSVITIHLQSNNSIDYHQMVYYDG